MNRPDENTQPWWFWLVMIALIPPAWFMAAFICLFFSMVLSGGAPQ